MNVKLNRRIQEMQEVEQAYFMPSCGDESNPIGACYDHAARNNLEIKPLRNLYLGVSFSNEEIERYIHENNLKNYHTISRYDDIEMKIAELLANKEIVARFSGRCEWGARSLGNRAILAHPSHMESFYTINDFIKSRDFWMPFAPTILSSAAQNYLRGYDPKKIKTPHYMITAFAASELGLIHLRAALHQGDHTLRPQVLEHSMNPDFYRLIKIFEDMTGVGAVLNTSFNMHGYPLVATIEQAILTFERSDLRFLVLGNYLLSKR
jgi:carbamoyltransferase